MWNNVRGENSTSQTAATETRQAFPAFLRNPPASSQKRANSYEGQEVRIVPRRVHGSPLPDVGRPSGFLSSKNQPNYVDPAPVAELVTEAEEYVRASDPLMAGMGDGKGEPWVPERMVEHPTITGDDNIARPAHYARYAIEPCTFILANELPFAEGNVVKYICRWRFKNGREDLEKAKRYVEMILEDLDRREAGTLADCVGKPL